jgi:hypothetical protein
LRHAWREENYEDDDKDMGALCFTRRVRKTRVPKGFKLPHDQHKYDGSQEPTLWLSDYLQAVATYTCARKLAAGSKLLWSRRPCAWCLTSQLGTPRGRYDECSG